MLTAPSSNRLIRFGVFELDVCAGELRKSGIRLPIQGRPLEVLAVLLERPRELVTHDQLRALLWPSDTFVDFDHAIRNAIARLRESLGDSAEEPRYVETLPRRGYRFIGRIEDGFTRTPVVAIPSVQGESSVSPGAKMLLRWFIAAALVLLVSAVVVITTRNRNARLGQAEIRSIAVLPLANLSGDPADDYFVDGMTEEVTTDLAMISGLRVISRTSMMEYKNVHKPLAAIARDLNVDAVVEGSVRRSGNRVRITAQLIRASNEEHLWARAYEGDVRDVLALQGAVARAVADETKAKLTAEAEKKLSNARPVDPETYQLVLRSRYFINNQRTAEGLQKAIGYAQRAVTLDPGSALAQAALADAFSNLAAVGGAAPREAMPKAKAAATRAVSLDEKLGDAHAALGLILLNYDWDTAAAGRELRRALELNPNSAQAHGTYAHYFLLSGKPEEAIEEAKLQQKLDPLSMFANRNLGRFLYLARRYDEAIEQLQRTAELHPHSTVLYNWLSWCYEQKKMYKEAMEMDLRDASNGGEPEEVLAALRTASHEGWKAYWQKWLEIARNEHGDQRGYSRAQVYIRLGNRDEAMRCLQRSADEREVWMTDIRLAPHFDSLHTDPRFRELLRRMAASP
jgi:TolB-like protein/DNA-binding winged helix-turn-helix (wHTH) protein